METGYALRAAPDDFQVEEVPLYEPPGEGGHTFVWVEKRLRTTEEVARALARAAAVRAARRRLRGPQGPRGRGAPVALGAGARSGGGARPRGAAGLRVLDARRHRHKLRTGQLRANRFRLVVRDVDPAALERAPERAAELAARRARRTASAPSASAPRGRTPSAPARCSPARPAPGRATGAPRASCSRRSRPPSSTRRWRAARCPSTPSRPATSRWYVPRAGCFLVEDLEREQPRAARFEISATGPDLRHAHDPGGGRAGRARAGGLRGLRHRSRGLPAAPRACARGARGGRCACAPPDLSLVQAGERALALAFELPGRELRDGAGRRAARVTGAARPGYLRPSGPDPSQETP